VERDATVCDDAYFSSGVSKCMKHEINNYYKQK